MNELMKSKNIINKLQSDRQIERQVAEQTLPGPFKKLPAYPTYD